MLKAHPNLRVRLAEKDIKQTYIAEQLGVSKQTMNGWVRGRIQTPLAYAILIAKVLDSRVEDLWELKEEEKRELGIKI